MDIQSPLCILEFIKNTSSSLPHLSSLHHTSYCHCNFKADAQFKSLQVLRIRPHSDTAADFGAVYGRGVTSLYLLSLVAEWPHLQRSFPALHVLKEELGSYLCNNTKRDEVNSLGDLSGAVDELTCLRALSVHLDGDEHVGDAELRLSRPAAAHSRAARRRKDYCEPAIQNALLSVLRKL